MKTLAFVPSDTDDYPSWFAIIETRPTFCCTATPAFYAVETSMDKAPLVDAYDGYLSEHAFIRVHLDATKADANKRGIHLLDATNDELAVALEQAQRDLFADIWLH